MARRDDSLPQGRIRRAAKLGTMVGREAAKGAAVKASTVGRADKRQIRLEEWQIQAAEQAVETLGSMKGLAMKAGQVASFLDTGMLEPEANARIQAKLAELRDSAPRVAFEDMRKVIETDLGEPLEDVFSEFQEDSIAAASIGQVYCAKLPDGRDVAVKVQYPGIATAVRADLQNLGLIMRIAKRIAPGMDAKAMAREIRERITEELDYEAEAQHQREFARRFRGHPFVKVPDVMTDLTHEHVLVQEYVEGIGFEEVRKLPQEERDRFGEIVFRFFFRSLYGFQHFSGDPHPGNYLLCADGRVTFLDYGMTKKLAPNATDSHLELVRALMTDDEDTALTNVVRRGMYKEGDTKITGRRVLDQFKLISWYLRDEELTVDNDLVVQVALEFGDPRSENWDIQKRGTMPPDAMMPARMEILTAGVLAQLEARRNWSQIFREIAFGDPPATPLGEEEAGFWSGRRAA
ncbi:MAG: AarF/ABC1/UbiB kinase family protein [Thermoleophilaceae bacterium]|nr:AarF/ABC1/UbiB kinase family protein [Thermoleophilaceae bacterium]